jgi:hypothetical protein
VVDKQAPACSHPYIVAGAVSAIHADVRTRTTEWFKLERMVGLVINQPRQQACKVYVTTTITTTTTTTTITTTTTANPSEPVSETLHARH